MFWLQFYVSPKRNRVKKNRRQDRALLDKVLFVPNQLDLYHLIPLQVSYKPSIFAVNFQSFKVYFLIFDSAKGSFIIDEDHI